MSKLNTDNSYEGTLSFIDHHTPALEAGLYTIEAQQTVGEETTIPATKEFVVTAPRFTLGTDQIHAHFPPRGGIAAYEGVIPTLGIRRSTLPWERSPFKNATTEGSSWLALLLVNEEEQTAGKIKELYDDTTTKQPKKLGEVKDQLGIDNLENWVVYDKNMAVNILEIEDELYQNALPAGTDLKWLSHNRQNITKDGEKKGEFSYLISHRIPKVDQLNTVYLVSVEQRYTDETATTPKLVAGGGKQQLVWLYKWSFYCKPEMLYSYIVNSTILQKAVMTYPSVTMPSVDALPSWVNQVFEGDTGRDKLKAYLLQDLSDITTEGVEFILDKAKKAQGTFEHILETIDVDRLQEHPITGGQLANSTAQKYLNNGCSVLKHHLRSGGQTYSWYRGPLSALAQSNKGFSFPVNSADDLLIFDQTTGMFDTTYSAAWALGHLKGIEEKALAAALYRWRHSKRHAHHYQQQPYDASHLHPVTPVRMGFPTSISQQMDKWKILKGIPFNYLVPKVRMLPPESLRFFHVDPNWLRALMDGFFSVGKVSGVNDYEEERKHFPSFEQPITGILLRSAAVAGWPAMHLNPYQVAVTGDDYDSTPKPMVPIIRKAFLEKEVMLVLFQGVPKTLDLYLSPEGLHSGFERDDTPVDNPRYTHRIAHPLTAKELVSDKAIMKVEAISNEKGQREYNTFSAADLAATFKARVENYRDHHPDATIPSDFEMTTGHFGMELINGAPLVRFQLNND